MNPPNVKKRKQNQKRGNNNENGEVLRAKNIFTRGWEYKYIAWGVLPKRDGFIYQNASIYTNKHGLVVFKLNRFFQYPHWIEKQTVSSCFLPRGYGTDERKTNLPEKLQAFVGVGGGGGFKSGNCKGGKTFPNFVLAYNTCNAYMLFFSSVYC